MAGKGSLATGEDSRACEEASVPQEPTVPYQLP